MSRYTVDTGIEIGWDDPFGEYFAQIFDKDDELEDEYMSVHLSPVIDWVQQNGFKVGADTIVSLLKDADKPWEPGPLQKQLGFEARP